MVDFFQYFDFSNNTLSVCLVLDPWFFKYFYCNQRPFLNMFAKFYGAESTFSKIMEDFIIAG